MFESVKELFLKYLKHDVRLIEKQVRSIEPGRGSLNFFKQDFDWSKIRLDQSKFLKSSFLEKIIKFLKAYLKALNIRYKNA